MTIHSSIVAWEISWTENWLTVHGFAKELDRHVTRLTSCDLNSEHGSSEHIRGIRGSSALLGEGCRGRRVVGFTPAGEAHVNTG